MTHRRNEKNLRALNRFKRRQIYKPILLKAYGHLEDNEDAHSLEGAMDVKEVVVTFEDADKEVKEDPRIVEDHQHIKAIAVIVIITNYLRVITIVSQVISQKDVLKDDVKVVHKINHRIT